jgi:predicted kinase
MPALYTLCGLAFAGKTTVARRVAGRLGAGLVSLDAIHEERGLFPGGDLDVANWRETGRIAEERTRDLLRQGRSAVVDDTFSYRFQRERFRRLAAEEGAAFLILFVDTPAEVMAARIEANRREPTRGHVLPHVVEFIRNEFEPPASDEPFVRFVTDADVERWLAQQA